MGVLPGVRSELRPERVEDQADAALQFLVVLVELFQGQAELGSEALLPAGVQAAPR